MLSAVRLFGKDVELPLGANALSPGACVILSIAVVSALVRLCWPVPEREGMEMWAFAKTHVVMYEPIVEQWSTDKANSPMTLTQIGTVPLSRRLTSGFRSGTPLADLIEVERTMVSQVFAGPLEGVGFVDLTDRLAEEGLYDQINAPSFAPWRKEGRLFGLPHDVHPMMLCYRSDIIEAAGIDVAQIETWDDFVRILKPLQDIDGDGRADRYLLNLGISNTSLIEALILQAGGGLLDEEGRLVVNSEVNHRVLARLTRWVSDGPDRIAIDAAEFSASGNQLKLEGRVLCSLMPDWLAAVWKSDLPQLAGKVKLMPLPAWEPGGTRTSVWGGTMLGIPRSSPHFDEAWRFAKELYLSRELAETLYREANIISPVKRFWGESWYDEPDPYFSGQAVGRDLVTLAPTVPIRCNSPYNQGVVTRVRDALMSLRDFSEAADQPVSDAALVAEAGRLMAAAEELIGRQMARNVFLQEATP